MPGRPRRIPSSGCNLIVRHEDGRYEDLRKDCCTKWCCDHCGWDENEIQRRRADIREHGLTRRRDGLRTLVIGKRRQA